MRKVFLHTGRTISLLLAASLLLPVAAGAADGATLDTRVERLERRISHLTDLMMQIDALKRENSELRGLIEEQAHTIRTLTDRQRDLYIDIDQRLSRLQSAPEETSSRTQTQEQPAASGPAPVTEISINESASGQNSNAAVSGASSSTGSSGVSVQAIPLSATISEEEQRAYDNANRLLLSPDRRYDEAISAFQAFLKKYPNSRLAANAQYWLAEAYYVSQKNDQALLEFSKVMQHYPKSSKVAGAMLKTGYIHQARGEPEQARDMLDRVVKRFPRSSEAALAKQRLLSMPKP